MVRIFRGFGFAVHSPRGSHIKLRRTRADGTTETLTIPAHREIKLGTLHEIFAQAARFIPEAELRPHLYTD
ncbi:MAG: type II toxin-antitoxin system HicA family toxin [Candidatus Rokuibacteriota bacterium]